MHRIFARQLAEATTESGEIDLARLGELVVSTYEDMNRDRVLADRSVSRIAEKLDAQSRERDRTAELLRQQKLQLDAALNNMAHGLCMFDAEGRIVLFNQIYADRMELPAEVLMGMSLCDLLKLRKKTGRFTGDPEEFFADLLAVLREGKTSTKILVDADGRALRIIDRPLPGGGWVATFQDITEQRRLEQERDRERTLLNAVIESVPVAILVRTVSDRRYVLANHAAEKYVGLPRESIIGKTVADLLPEDSAAIVMSHDEDMLKTGRMFCDEHPIELRGMGTRLIASTRVPLKGKNGETEFFLAVVDDVTERRRLEAAERHNAEVLTATITSMLDAVLVTDEGGRVIVANPAAKRLFGGRTDVGSEDWVRTFECYRSDGITPIPFQERPISRVGLGESVENVEIVMRSPDRAGLVHLIANGAPLRDASGAQKGGVVVYRDVSQAKETEQQLRQAQKMEAIGQLTGGVAHDFNNILTVITGTIEILEQEIVDPTMAAFATMISRAADRGAALTSQLLAFSRKQALQPEEADVNVLIRETTKLLQASLGEHIEINSVLADDAWPALVDTSQLSAALVNLALNARDAMPNGGRLTFETANALNETGAALPDLEAPAGEFVLIAVSDTGTGIPAAFREKVFEPFFTTKEVGKGSGLGLSMVYGFVKQSGGQIKIYSEEGQGTTIKIYLPKANGKAERIAKAPTDIVRGSGETVLVVEDDELVRAHTIAQLQSLGYHTLEAGNGREALALIDGGVEFDLLFTDVIMPGAMNGRELAEAAVSRRSALKVLFTSGYTENAMLKAGRLRTGVLLLTKPYRKAELARMLRAALDANPYVSAA
jgi:PAS domain S-box-containing protein